MMRGCNVTALAARSASLSILLAGAALASVAWGQEAQAPQAAAQPASTAPVEAAKPPPRALSESVAAVVNDDIISSYDLAQRVRLLIDFLAERFRGEPWKLTSPAAKASAPRGSRPAP